MDITKGYFDNQFESLRRNLDSRFENIDGQFSSIRQDIKEIKKILSAVDKRDLEDSNAFAKTLLSMNKDIEALKAR